MANRPVVLVSNEGKLVTSKDTTTAELARQYVPDFKKVRLPFAIPRDPQMFLDHFGGLTHPRDRDENGLPVRVTRFTSYQIQFWHMNYGVMLKTNKAGVTTSESLGDFHSRLLPEWAGFDCLIVAQTQKMANEHVLDLKKLVMNSRNYSQFLIKRPDFEELKEEKTKVGVMYVRNPYNPQRKSRIIGIGGSEAMAYSWKNINRLHITDPSLLKMKKQDDFFAGLFSRLANTNGQIKIEGVPKYRTGWFWKMCKTLFKIEDQFEDSLTDEEKARLSEDDIPDDIINVFDKIFVTIDDAVREGVISADFREKMRRVMSPAKYRQTFMGEFARPEGAVFGSFPIGGHEAESW